MISSEEALTIFRRWRESGSTLKMIAVKPTGEGGATSVGKLEIVTPDSIAFTSGGIQNSIPLAGTVFRKLDRTQVIDNASSDSWDESIELRWVDSGNFLLFFRLVVKNVPKSTPAFN